MNPTTMTAFLNSLINKQITAFTINGKGLRGRLVSYDSNAILLDDNAGDTLVFINNITAITPNKGA